jgi:outer membrane protein assembly factor BamB
MAPASLSESSRGVYSTNPKSSAMILRLLPLLFLTSGAIANGTSGNDWPGWRGPEGTGISTERAWSSTAKEAPLWEKELGLGHASFAVVGDHVYTLGFDAELELDTVYCLDVNTGEECWTHSYKSNIWDLGHDGGASTTPTVIGDAVYTSNREGNVFCLDAHTGAVRWHRKLAEEWASNLRSGASVRPPSRWTI